MKPLHTLKSFMFFYHAANTIIISFLPLYFMHKGLSGTEIGFVLAIGPVAAMLSQPLWGYLSDKYKSIRLMLIITVIGMIMMSIIFFQMSTFYFILIFAASFFFFSQPIGALSDSLGQRQAQLLHISFGSIRMWGSIGFAFSALIVGNLLDFIGVEYMLIPYLIFSGCLLVFSFLITDVAGDNTPVQLKDISILIKNKPFIVFLGIILFITIGHRANDSFIGVYMLEVGGTEAMVGTAWFIALATEATILATASFWYRRFHAITFLILASILYAVRWAIFYLTNDPYIILVQQLLHGLTFGVFYLAAFDYIAKIIPKILQSTGHVIFYATMFSLSGMIGSLFGGIIIDTFNGHTLYMYLALSALLGTTLLTIYRVYIAKK